VNSVCTDSVEVDLDVSHWPAVHHGPDTLGGCRFQHHVGSATYGKNFRGMACGWV
jgi:hypothetical protein